MLLSPSWEMAHHFSLSFFPTLACAGHGLSFPMYCIRYKRQGRSKKTILWESGRCDSLLSEDLRDILVPADLFELGDLAHDFLLETIGVLLDLGLKSRDRSCENAHREERGIGRVVDPDRRDRDTSLSSRRATTDRFASELDRSRQKESRRDDRKTKEGRTDGHLHDRVKRVDAVENATLDGDADHG